MALKVITIEAKDKDGSLLGTATVSLSKDASECIGTSVVIFEDGDKTMLWQDASDHHADAVRQAIIGIQATIRSKAKTKGDRKTGRKSVMDQL